MTLVHAGSPMDSTIVEKYNNKDAIFREHHTEHKFGHHRSVGCRAFSLAGIVAQS